MSTRQTIGFLLLAVPAVFGAAVEQALHAAQPKLLNFHPAHGPAGTPLRIVGEGLMTTTNVLIGTERAVFEILGDGLILATVPRKAKTGTIQIVTQSGIAVSRAPFVAAPSIERLNPEFGAPGEPIIISGHNLGNASTVHFGTVSVRFRVLGDTQLSALVPDVTGLLPITVTTSVGQATLEGFEATGRTPFVREFRPEFASPGMTVSVEGKNFIGSTQFLFGEVPASFVVTSDTQIQLTIPAEAPSGPVTLHHPAGIATSRVAFRVIGTGPFVEAIKPEVGSPGDIITLEGINLTGTQSIRFGAAVAPFTVTADTQIRVTIPNDAESGPLTLTSPRGTSVSEPEFTLSGAAPFIEDFRPLTVTAGQLVQVHGRNFTGITSVLIGETTVAFSVVADIQLNIITLSEPMTGKITLTHPEGITRSTEPLVVSGATPRISRFIPPAGRLGDTIRIQGGNFATATNVWFGTLPAEYTIVADNEIEAIVPNQALTAVLTVDTPGGRAESTALFHLPPRIDRISHPGAVPGDSIEIDGANFLGTTQVLFGTEPGALLSVKTSHLKVKVPPEAKTGPLSISNPAGINAAPIPFEIYPELTAFSPPAAPVGAPVVIQGRGLLEVSEVRFGPLPAEFKIRSSSEILAHVPLNGFEAPLSVINPVGSSRSHSSFIVIASADLSLSAELSPATPSWQTSYRLRSDISSRGPSTLRNGRLTFQLPPGSLVHKTSNSHGACEVVQNTVTCSLVSLPAGETATLELDIHPTYYGRFQATVRLESPLFDPTPEADQLTLPVTISGPPPAIRIDRPAGEPLTVSWPKAAADFVLQTTTNPTAPETWANVEGPFDGDQETNRFRITSPHVLRFFRLLDPLGDPFEVSAP